MVLIAKSGRGISPGIEARDAQLVAGRGPALVEQVLAGDVPLVLPLERFVGGEPVIIGALVLVPSATRCSASSMHVAKPERLVTQAWPAHHSRQVESRHASAQTESSAATHSGESAGTDAWPGSAAGLGSGSRAETSAGTCEQALSEPKINPNSGARRSIAAKLSQRASSVHRG